MSARTPRESTRRTLNPPYGIIREEIKRGGVIPFLGAGASLGAQRAKSTTETDSTSASPHGTSSLPSGGQLRTQLAILAALDLSRRENRFIELATVAQYFEHVSTRRILDRTLHEIFAADYECGAIHRFLAGLEKPLLILTTNYDDMLEYAFKELGKAFDLVIHQTQDEEQQGCVLFLEHGKSAPEYVKPRELDIDLAKRLETTSVIYKMHGTVAKGDPLISESFVITEDDYVDFLIKLGANTPIPAAIEAWFYNRQFLFLGYGLGDWNFRVMLASLKSHFAGRGEEARSWAIRWKGSNVEEKLWSKRGVLTFEMKVDEFAEQMRRIM